MSAKQLVFSDKARKRLKEGIEILAHAGTTTAPGRAPKIVIEGLKSFAAGTNPMLIKHGIEKATAAAVEAIRAQSQKIETKEEIASGATNSAADSQIGGRAPARMEKVG